MEFFSLSPYLHNILSWLAGVSLVTFLLSLLLIPVIVGRLAPDYFLKFKEKKRRTRHLTPWTLCLLILRNALGVCLVLAGILMLFLPGQGLLTILLGLLLLSLPGKYRLIDRLTAIRGVRRSLDWLREKDGKPPFIWSDSANGPARQR